MHPVSISMALLLGAFVAFSSGAEKELLAVGANAPDFSLKSEKGETIVLSYVGKNAVVLIFYPGDQTPVCTEQLCAVRDSYADFGAKGAVVFGVNPADAVSHQKFKSKQEYQFPLLVDEGKTVTAAYGAKGGIMTTRTVYVVGKDGKIIYAKRGKPPVAEILGAIVP